MGVSTEDPPPPAPPPPPLPPVEGLARDFNDLRKRASKPRGPSWFMRLVAAGVVVGIILPVLWVLIYGIVEAPGTILMAQRAGQGEDVRRDTVPLSAISPHLVRAVIAAEDARFCKHNGFDAEAIQKAVKYNERARKRGSDKRRGASTISQQTAKNLFLWPQRSWVRKGLEVYFTFLIEALWPKRRIMEAYLNAAEWGDGLFGAEAAAQARFGKSASQLTAREAARLASVLPSPNKWNPVSPGPYVRGRANAIVSRASVVRNEGLAACVLGKEGGAARPGKRKQEPEELPPLPAPPPELAPPEEGSPVEVVAPVDPLPPLGDMPAEGEAAPPAEESTGTGAEPEPVPEEPPV
jgi:monofunctional glycosyltransferase